VGDTEATDQRLCGQRLFQLADFAWATHAFKRCVIAEDCHTRAVITPVFEALQTFEQDGGDITFCNRADNSTHAISPD
jgi:hypothetical protein